MITNGTAIPENYYRINFNGLGYEVYGYGVNALEAIATARQDNQAIGNATARPAIYKEWECDPKHFTNGGKHLPH